MILSKVILKIVEKIPLLFSTELTFGFLRDYCFALNMWLVWTCFENPDTGTHPPLVKSPTPPTWAGLKQLLYLIGNDPRTLPPP